MVEKSIAFTTTMVAMVEKSARELEYSTWQYIGPDISAVCHDVIPTTMIFVPTCRDKPFDWLYSGGELLKGATFCSTRCCRLTGRCRKRGFAKKRHIRRLEHRENKFIGGGRLSFRKKEGRFFGGERAVFDLSKPGCYS
jgi:hypothetical protein